MGPGSALGGLLGFNKDQFERIRSGVAKSGGQPLLEEEAGVSKLVEVSSHRPFLRKEKRRKLTLPVLVPQGRAGKGEPILKEACSQGYPEAQLAFKDLMIH